MNDMGRIIESRELEPMAFLQAGRAVMAFFESVPVRPVQIQPETAAGGGSPFYAAHWPDWADPSSEKFSLRSGREWFEKRMVVTFAGCVAERLHSSHGESGSEVDWDRAQVAAVGFWSGEKVTAAWLHWLYTRAEEAIEQPYAWQNVRTIAVELLNRRTFNGRAEI